MSEAIEQFFAAESDSEYSDIRGIEYMFHDAVELGCLSNILDRFPNAEEVQKLIQSKVMHFENLPNDWENLLLSEVCDLIALTPRNGLKIPARSELGEPDYGNDEMFALRSSVGRALRKLTGHLSGHERAFLDDFFYGVDFTHWTKWAILMHYAETSLRVPTILKARRNGVDFAISGGTLIYKMSGKSVPS